MTDSYVAVVPDRQALVILAGARGLAVDLLDSIVRALEAPRRDAARRTRERILKLEECQLQVQAPIELQAIGPRPPRASGPGPKPVAPIKVGAGADRRKRHLGDEGERWALAAVIRQF
jgi:hypothetical protein